MPAAIAIGMIASAGVAAASADHTASVAKSVAGKQATAALQEGDLKQNAALQANAYARTAQQASQSRLGTRGAPQMGVGGASGMPWAQQGPTGVGVAPMGAPAGGMAPPAGSGQGTVRLTAPDGTTSDVPAQLAGHYLALGARMVNR